MKPHFTLFGIPVFVRVSFFILVLVLGAGSYHQPQEIAIFGAVAFLGVMMHELGHAFVGRAFGLAPMIQVVGLGGLTSWIGGRNVGPGRSLLISLAGPAVGITIGSLTWFLSYAHGDFTNPFVSQVVGDAIWVNLGWGVLNLLPMLPLDGGNVMHQLIALLTGTDGERPARVISIVVGVVAAIAGYLYLGLFTAILVAMLVAQNVRALRPAEAPPGPPAPPPPQQARW